MKRPIVLSAYMAMAGIAFADGHFAGVFETTVVSNDESQTVSQPVVTAPSGQFVKIGEGRLTVPFSQLPQQTMVDVCIRQGSAAFADGVAVPTEPTAVMSKAAFWFDAAAVDTVKTVGDGEDLDVWLDRRETGNASVGYRYPRAVPNLRPANLAPKVVTQAGKRAVYFGGYTSGSSADWRLPDGQLMTLSNIRHVFLLNGVWNSWGFILGGATDGLSAGGSCKFHIAQEGGVSTTASLFRSDISVSVPVVGRVFLNGEWIDPANTAPCPEQFQLLEIDCCGALGEASNFFNDRNYFASNPQMSQIGGNRVGGDYISEALVFTNELTEAERLQVGTWLMNKWLDVRRPNVRVALAEGAEVGLDDAERVGVTVVGDGQVVKSGASTQTILCSPGRQRNVPVRVNEGSLELSPRQPLAFADGDRYTVSEPDYSSPVVTRSGDAGKGAAVKDGNGIAVLERLPTSVSNLSVRAGTLVLSHPAGHVRPWKGEVARIPNGSFVGWSESAGFRQVMPNDIYANWHVEVTNQGTDARRDVVIFTGGNGTGSEWASAGDPYGAPLPSPDGGNVMMVKGNASAWSELTVTEGGSFVVRFNTNARKYWNTPITLDLCIRRDDGAFATLGSFSQAFAAAYVPRSYRTPYLPAGSYQLWFKTRAEDKDGTIAIHDLRIEPTGVAVAGRESVPNGELEFQKENAAAGWTLTGATWVKKSQGVTSFDAAYNRVGQVQIAFGHAGDMAETTFVATRSGVWNLGLRACSYSYRYGAPGWGVVACSAVVNGTSVSLGTQTFKALHLADYAFPKSFAVEAGDEVTLRLTYTDGRMGELPHVLMDDFELVEAGATDGPELVENGSFETDGGWGFITFPKQDGGVSGSQRRAYSQYPDNYGRAVYDGDYWCSIVQKDVVWRWVTISEGGLYRLRFHVHSRVDSNLGYGKNPVKVYWIDADNAPNVTNWIGVAAAVSTNFVERTFDFVLPEKSKAYGIKLFFQGSYSHIAGDAEYQAKDRTTILDGVSLKKVATNGTGLPDLPGISAKTGVLNVETGARLRLDYDGTLRLGALTLGGKTVEGEISSATKPDFISGPGKIYVKEKRGFILIFK